MIDKLHDLSKVKWDDGWGIENLLSMGIDRIRSLNCAIQDDCEHDFPRGKNHVLSLSYLIDEKLIEVESAVNNFIKELELKHKKKKKE